MGMTYTLTLNADGSAQMAGKKTTSSGAWHLSKAGYCSKRESAAGRCYSIAPNGRHHDETNTSGKLIAT
jgi:hypothetical protein